VSSDALHEDIKLQLDSQGLACYRVKDGQIFLFTRAVLLKLLEKTEKADHAVLFVKSRPEV